MAGTVRVNTSKNRYMNAIYLIFRKCTHILSFCKIYDFHTITYHKQNEDGQRPSSNLLVSGNLLLAAFTGETAPGKGGNGSSCEWCKDENPEILQGSTSYKDCRTEAACRID